MKKLIALLVLFFFAGTCFAQIATTAHDFSDATWNGTSKICIVCHTPHNATTANAPLWNRGSSSVSYTVYSGTLDAGTVGQPSESSKLCLSCHDGTVALENFGGTTGGVNFVSDGDLGTDLSDDHPISISYTTAIATADGELVDPESAGSSGLGGTIQGDMLFNDQLQCASCHDVHGTGHDFLLLKDNAGSALCITCHEK